MQNQIAQIYQQYSRQVYATLVRLLGDFNLAEEALQDAFKIALEKWPGEGIPQNPVPWLISTGRFKAIDRLRREARFTSYEENSTQINNDSQLSINIEQQLLEQHEIEDDQLRLIFTCCHPALAQNIQVALTLREVCGLTTEQIAQAFLLPATTLAQRIVRAKNKIKNANIPYQIPPQQDLPERLASVLQVIYLVYNEGYSASSGDNLLSQQLTNEAIRLTQLLQQLLPDNQIDSLLALMLLNDSRATARLNKQGDLIPLEQQNRSLWDKKLIKQGSELIQRVLQRGELNKYSIQAAISAVHAEAETFKHTDWEQIIGLYDVLLRIENNPVILLNRAVAIAMRDGASAGLLLLTTLIQDKQLKNYHLTYAVQADLLRRTEKYQEALRAYRQALALTQQQPEKRFLSRQIQIVEEKLKSAE